MNVTIPDHSLTTLGDMRALLADLYHEIGNRGGEEGRLFRQAYEVVLWLAVEYLKPQSAGENGE